MASLPLSLLKYDNPNLIVSRRHGEPVRSPRKDGSPERMSPGVKGRGSNSPRSASPPFLPRLSPTHGASSPPFLPSISPTHGASRSPVQDEETRALLDDILPPREITGEDGQLWMQHVSSAPATRLDVLRLSDQLDLILQQQQARETGICHVRRQIYTQCFDELIRQVTINCAEQGFLLVRVRDELNMTLVAFQTLYESSIAFGIRKALQAECGKSELQDKNRELETLCQTLENQVAHLKSKCEEIEKRAAEKHQLLEKKHSEDMQLLVQSNQQLKAQLESIISPRNK